MDYDVYTMNNEEGKIMMKHEFEEIAKREVTDEQFEAIEKLYMSSTLNKQDFVKSIRPMLKTIPELEKEKNIKK